MSHASFRLWFGSATCLRQAWRNLKDLGLVEGRYNRSAVVQFCARIVAESTVAELGELTAVKPLFKEEPAA